MTEQQGWSDQRLDELLKRLWSEEEMLDGIAEEALWVLDEIGWKRTGTRFYAITSNYARRHALWFFGRKALTAQKNTRRVNQIRQLVCQVTQESARAQSAVSDETAALVGEYVAARIISRRYAPLVNKVVLVLGH